MRVVSLTLKNFRSFVDAGPLELGQINVLVGPNNTGKSSVIRGLYMLQQGSGDVLADVRVGTSVAQVSMTLSDIHKIQVWGASGSCGDATFLAKIESTDRRAGTRSFNLTSIGHPDLVGEIQFPAEDPRHFIVPYLSKRKAPYYAEEVKESTTHSVLPQMTNLAARLSRLANPAFPAHKAYAQACEQILGVIVTVIPSPNGQRPGIYLPDMQTVPIDQMGEGVPNVVELLASLALSEGKLFLIEEPENDVHPAALKALLELVIQSSSKNQFVISTHSNIVVRHLCSLADSRLFQVKATLGVLPTVASIELVGNEPESRMAVLRDLGYELSDFELWDGWLILEESSAERIIRDYLIPWFAPKLSRIRTLSANGASKVAPAFEEFRRLFLFAHLEPVYRNRAWVRVDGDRDGVAVVEKLRGAYKDIAPEKFASFQKAQFEHYYPSAFAADVAAALSTSDPQLKREAKRLLVESVRRWLEEDEARGRTALEESAAEVIADLRSIERELLGATLAG